jgi:YqaJ-like viral recombinase domain
MSIHILDCEQRSYQWHHYRLGIPTASEFHTVMTTLKSGGETAARRTYMHKLAGEQITGEPHASYLSQAMLRGQLIEDAARAYYSLMTNHEIQRVGFILDDELRCGASPDGLVGDDGMLEIKSRAAHLLCEDILADQLHPQHYAQCQGQLWLADRAWVDLLHYWPKMPRFEKRILRDDEFIKKLAAAIKQFNEELDAMVDYIRRYGEPAPAIIEDVRAAG